MPGSLKIGCEDMLEFAEQRPMDVGIVLSQTDGSTDADVLSEYVVVSVELCTDGKFPSKLISRHLELHRQAEQHSGTSTELEVQELLKLYYPDPTIIRDDGLYCELSEQCIVATAREHGPEIGDQLDNDKWARFCAAAQIMWPKKKHKDAVFDFTTAAITLKFMIDSLNEPGTNPIDAARHQQKEFMSYLDDLEKKSQSELEVA